MQVKWALAPPGTIITTKQQNFALFQQLEMDAKCIGIWKLIKEEDTIKQLQESGLQKYTHIYIKKSTASFKYIPPCYLITLNCLCQLPLR